MTQENREAVKRVLMDSASPKSAAQLSRVLPKSAHLSRGQLNALLEDMVTAGEVFLWSKGRFWDREPRKMVSGLILQFLAQYPFAGVGRLKTALGVPLELLQPALAELQGSGRIYLWQPASTPYYGLVDPQEAAREIILKAIADGPLAEKDLTAWVRKRLPGYQARHLKEHISSIERVRVYPKYGRLKLRYGLGPPEPGPYLLKATDEIEAVYRLLTPFQVSLPEILDALRLQLGLQRQSTAIGPDKERAERPSMPLEQAVWDGIARLQPPGQGRALVSIRELRRSLGLPRQVFDQAVFSLAVQGRVALHRHDFASSLGPQEREELLQDGQGTYYVGIVPKEVS